MKRCIVTGGAGFIGSHLCDRLLAEGHEVIAIDNLATGRRENLAAAERSKKFSFYQADVAQFSSIKPLFEGVDWVFHLAALADIVPSMQKPLDYLHANVVGTTNVVEAVRLADVKRLVYAASSSCYGIPDIYPTPETAEVKPQYPYALTKYLGEEAVMHWCKSTSCRPSRCGCSTSTDLAVAPRALTARCSACSWHRSWPVVRSRWLATARRRVTSRSSPTWSTRSTKPHNRSTADASTTSAARARTASTGSSS